MSLPSTALRLYSSGSVFPAREAQHGSALNAKSVKRPSCLCDSTSASLFDYLTRFCSLLSIADLMFAMLWNGLASVSTGSTVRILPLPSATNFRPLILMVACMALLLLRVSMQGCPLKSRGELIPTVAPLFRSFGQFVTAGISTHHAQVVRQRGQKAIQSR